MNFRRYGDQPTINLEKVTTIRKVTNDPWITFCFETSYVAWKFDEFIERDAVYEILWKSILNDHIEG